MLIAKRLRSWMAFASHPGRWFAVVAMAIGLFGAAQLLAAQEEPGADAPPAEETQAEESPPSAEAPADGEASPQDVVSVKDIQTRIGLLEHARELTEPEQRALDVLRQALASAQRAEEYAAQAKEFQRLAQAAPQRQQEVEAKLAQPAAEPVAESGNLTADELRQKLAAAQAALETARQARQKTEDEAARRPQRREQIPQEMTALRSELADIEQRIHDRAGSQEPQPVVDAQNLKLQADRLRLEQHIASLQEELRSYDARRDLLRLERQAAERSVNEAEKLAQAWQQAVTTREQQEAARLAQEAQRAEAEAAAVHPLVGELAETNREYTRERTELVPRIEQKNAELAAVTATLQRLRDDLRGVKSRTDRSGTTTTLGLLLRNKRSTLPDVADLRRSQRELRAEITRVQILRNDADDELLTLVNVEDHADRLLEAHPELGEVERERIRDSLIEQFRRRKEEFLPGLITSLDRYLEDTLVRLDQAETELIKVVDEYSAYVDERILWIRSAHPIDGSAIASAWDAGQWLLLGKHWRAAGEAAWMNALTNWSRVGPGLIAILVLLVLQRFAKQRIGQMATEIRSFRTDTLSRTFATLVLTAVRVAFLPAILWFFSAQFSGAGDVLRGESAIFARAIAEGLGRAARFMVVAMTLWHLCMPRGLAEAHFRWRIASLKLMRRNLLWLIPIAATMILVVGALEQQPNESFKASLGRLAFVALSIALATFLARVLQPSGGILQGYLSRRSGGWIDRLRYVWYSAAVAVPIALGLASLAGYHFTAVQLGRVVNKTSALIVGATILHGLLVRWLLVAQRRLAMEQARKRREAQAQAEAAAAAAATPAEGMSAGPAAPGAADAAAKPGLAGGELAIDEPEIDISAIGEQSRRLIQLGVWFALVIGLIGAWADVLPALGALRQVEIVEQLRAVTETRVSDDGTATVEVVNRLVPLTLADVLLAVLVVVLTVVAVRNIPGLLEISILQRLPLAPSGRYAVTTISKYLIIIVGIVLAFSMVGVGWSKVQWLAAAITVGLGFGLQEIFANFVSGIIMLFEQPVRVGDVVTVGDISGSVTRIRMRATTLRNADNKEILIPNKTFVTDRITNWTLSDNVLRISLPVSIAYGSDVQRVRSMLLQTAGAHPLVLREPAPQAWFNRFDDSALQFEFCVFVGNIAHSVQVRHDLLEAVDKAFRKAGIEIPFPQRDIHIRTGDLNPGDTKA